MRIAAMLFVFAMSAVPFAAKAAPVSVTVISDFQSELGCPSDFSADCPNSMLAPSLDDGVWRGKFDLPAFSGSYKIVEDQDFAFNYGLGGVANGANIPLENATAGPVRFYYDQADHWIADSLSSQIISLAGNFQSELGCASDFSPSCLRTWLKDKDGDGIYSFEALLPQGAWSLKVTYDESFDVNYGAGGVQNGANIDFRIKGLTALTQFLYDPRTHLLQIDTGEGGGPAPVPLPASWGLLAGAGMMLTAVRKRKAGRR